jgi:DNA-directed RNA polymerase III subunit RPC8
VQIAPEDFGKQSHAAIEDNINAKYANKVWSSSRQWFSWWTLLTKPQVVQKIGLFICLWDILWTSEGLIGHGDGYANVNGKSS